jgi:cell division protein FtsW (lipid II flippase)
VSERRRRFRPFATASHLGRPALPVLLLALAFLMSCLGRQQIQPASAVTLLLVGLAGYWEVRRRDWGPALVAMTLTLLGWVMLERLDTELALRQAVWILVALASRNLIGNARFQWGRHLPRLVMPLALLIAALQTTVFVAGTERHGAKNWVMVGGLSVQPGEFVKILLVLFLAALFSRYRHLMLPRAGRRWPHPSLLLLALVSLLVEATLVWQKDLGMALLSGLVLLAMFYLATGRLDLCGWAVGAGGVGAVLAVLAFPHVRLRLQSWLSPFEDPLGVGYQSAQAIYALSAGQLLGHGWGRGDPDLIPEAATDFITVAMVEELGLLGFLAVLLLLALLVGWCFVVALHCRDELSCFVAAGLGSIFAAQTLIVVGGCLRLMPLTGMTLPFVSYGGSSLLASWVSLALLEQIHQEQKGRAC